MNEDCAARDPRRCRGSDAQPAGVRQAWHAMGRDLLAVALRVEGDPAVRAVVVTGSGRHFGFGGRPERHAAQGRCPRGYLNELTTHIHSAITCFTACAPR